MTRGSTTQTVARNSFWYGLEMACQILTSIATSIAMARILGPHKLGYFNYIMWLANISGMLGSLGIPLTTRKYMAEYLGSGQEGYARAVFMSGLWHQSLVSVLITGAGLAAVFTVSEASFRHISAFQVASTLPAMVLMIPSQANLAAENSRANVAGSLIGQLLYVIAVVLSLWQGWDLFGIAVGIFVYRCVELGVRLVPVWRWVSGIPPEPLPGHLKKKLLTFSGQGTVLMLVQLIVWNRSDIVLLKMLTPDIAQVTFFSVAFNLTERIMVVPQTVASAIGASLMAQFGRDRSKLPQMASSSVRYMLLCSMPLLAGLAALSGPVIRVLYGVEYLAVIPVMAISAVLAIPRVIQTPGQQLMQATENQGFLMWWYGVCAALNLVLDIVLIPPLLANGAAIANGVTQVIAVVGIWFHAVRLFDIRLPWRAIVRLSAAVLGMSGAVLAVSAWAPAWVALPAGIVAGVAVFLPLLRFSGTLEEEDRRRLAVVGEFLPATPRRYFEGLVAMLAPR